MTQALDDDDEEWIMRAAGEEVVDVADQRGMVGLLVIPAAASTCARSTGPRASPHG